MLGYAIILIVVALALAFLEMLFPSGGLLGVLSLLALIGGIALGFTVSGMTGLLMLVLSATIGPVLMFFGFKMLPRSPMGKHLVLKPSVESSIQRGADGVSEKNFDGLLGRIGKTQTPLMPSGFAIIDGERYTVTADGEAIEKGDAVKVVRIEGNSITVIKLESSGIN